MATSRVVVLVCGSLLTLIGVAMVLLRLAGPDLTHVWWFVLLLPLLIGVLLVVGLVASIRLRRAERQARA